LFEIITFDPETLESQSKA